LIFFFLRPNFPLPARHFPVSFWLILFFVTPFPSSFFVPGSWAPPPRGSLPRLRFDCRFPPSSLVGLSLVTQLFAVFFPSCSGVNRVFFSGAAWARCECRFLFLDSLPLPYRAAPMPSFSHAIFSGIPAPSVQASFFPTLPLPVGGP